VTDFLPVVRLSPQRDHLHFYGALNLRTGHEFALPRPEMTSEATAEFLAELLYCYPDVPILLLWDRAPWHKGKAVQTLLAQHPRLETLFFPPACPDLNPQEHVWSLAREAVTHNHTLPDFPTVVQSFLRFLASRTFTFEWLSQYVPPFLLRQV
jgi:transposase